MHFRKYPSLVNHYHNKDIDRLEIMFGDRMHDCDWILTEKIHGCLREDTIIKTREFGEVSIKFLVDNSITCQVLSVNHENDEIEWDEVIDFSAVQDDKKEWYEVELEDGVVLHITGNHKVYDAKNRIYIAIEDLDNTSSDIFLLKI